MTRSVQVIAPFSTTGPSGMVNFTVLLPLTRSPVPRSLPFRLKISVSAVMVTSWFLVDSVTTTWGSHFADTPLTFVISAPE